MNRIILLLTATLILSSVSIYASRIIDPTVNSDPNRHNFYFVKSSYEFDFENEVLVFYNQCSYDCDLTGWGIKDQGRKNFVFSKFVLRPFSEIEVVVGIGIDNSTTLFWEGEDYVWTEIGDSLFLRDAEGKLVLWRDY